MTMPRPHLTLAERLTYGALLALLPLGLAVQHFEPESERVPTATWRSFIGPMHEQAESLVCVREEDA